MRRRQKTLLFVCNLPLFVFLFFISCRKEIITKYPDGSIYQINTIRSPFKEHILDGKSQMFYENGKLQIEAFYNDGKIEGIVRSFYPSGAKFGKKLMKNSKQNGYDSIWFENGKLNIVAHYKIGVLDGKYQKWDANGKYITLTSYKNGLEEGVRKAWDENGERVEAEIHKGILHGSVKTFDENGRLKAEGYVESGKPCGTTIFYDSTGAILEKKEHTLPCVSLK